jgi:hypothetical protein
VVVSGCTPVVFHRYIVLDKIGGQE